MPINNKSTMRGTDALEAQQMRSRLVDQTEYTAVQPVAVTKGTPLAQASDKYFANLEARGLDTKSIRTHRTGVDPFVRTCKKACVEDVSKQDMIDFMGWVRKQPLPRRRNSNPERNQQQQGRLRRNIPDGVWREQTAQERNVPATSRKRSSPTPRTNCLCSTGTPMPTNDSCWTSFTGSMARDVEAWGSRYTALTGATLTIQGKPHKTRTFEISPRLLQISWIVESTASPNISFPTGTENRTNICFGTCRASPTERRRNSTRNYTSCARREPVGGTLPAHRCRRSCRIPLRNTG
jgi:hypothetical protein